MPVIASMRPNVARDAAIVACLAALLYLPTLWFQLVWDDPMLIELTDTRLEAGGVGGVLSSEFTLGSRSDHTGYFRPVVLLSLVLDGWLGGGKAWMYHLTNVLLNAAVCALAFVLMRSMLEDRSSALFGGLLFAAHPVHVEAVAFVSGRTDLWAALFVFSAGLLWMLGRRVDSRVRSWRMAALSSVCVAVGTLSKEVAMMTVPAWLAWDAVGIGRPASGAASWSRRNAPWIAASLAAVAVVGALRWGVAGVSLVGAPPPVSVPGTDEPSALQLLAPRLAAYFRLLAIPWPSSAFYTASDLSPGPAVVLGALAAIAVFVLARVAGPLRIAAAGVSWTLLFLLPVLGIVTLSAGAAAERFLYIPSFGLCLAAAALWRAFHERRRAAALVIGTVIVLLFGGATLVRSQVWRSELSLYGDMARTSPRSFVAHFNLGNELAKAGRFEAAEASLARAVEVAPGRADGWNNLGSVRLRLGKDAEAEAAYAQAIRLKPDFDVALRNSASLLARMGRHDEAANRFGDLLARNPGDVQARQGQFEAHAAQNRWAKALLKLGRPAEALAALERLHDLGATDAPHLIEIGKSLAEAGQWPEAERAFRAAIAAAPDDARAYGDLGLVFLARGRVGEALPLLERAVKLDPEDAATRDNLAIARLARRAQIDHPRGVRH